MRELELTISETLKNGLKPDKVPLGAQVLEQCLGFRCGKIWLEGYDSISNPLNPLFSLNPTWPYPQFFSGEKYNFLYGRYTGQDRLYAVSKDHSTITLIATFTHALYPAITPMEFTDFGEYAFLTNGQVIVYRNVVTNTWVTMTSSATIPLMRTICNFKGQLIGGNVVSAWHDCDESSIIWGKIGQADFTPDEKNTAGFRRDPFGGEVYHVRRLGDNAIVYSSAGITAMLPISQPVPSFGYKEISDIGLINRLAVNGNVFKHVFVDTDYNLCEFTSEGLKVLGYQEQMYRLTGTIVINYDQSKKDFYISNGTLTYLYSPYGLTEVQQHPSAVWYSNKIQGMIPDAVDARVPYILTEPFDFGYRGTKTIFVTELGLTNYDTARIAIDWKVDNSTFKITGWQGINNEGIATKIITGSDFKIRVEITGVDLETIFSYIKVRYKMTDLKSIRGIYAPPPRGQSI